MIKEYWHFITITVVCIIYAFTQGYIGNEIGFLIFYSIGISILLLMQLVNKMMYREWKRGFHNGLEVGDRFVKKCLEEMKNEK